MYIKQDAEQLYLEKYILPFEGNLRNENRWGKLAQIMPGDTLTMFTPLPCARITV